MLDPNDEELLELELELEDDELLELDEDVVADEDFLPPPQPAAAIARTQITAIPIERFMPTLPVSNVMTNLLAPPVALQPDRGARRAGTRP